MNRRLSALTRRLAVLSSGAVMFGWLQGLDLVRFSEVFTQVLSSLFSALVSLLLGSNPNQVGVGGLSGLFT